MAEQITIGTYLGQAFSNRWNLLLLAASTAAAMISGHPDVLLPVIGAVELAYLTALATNKRFQWIVRARLEKSRTRSDALETAGRYRELYRGLNKEARERFDSLRARCEVLQDLAADAGVAIAEVTESRLIGVNRLLWVYLKLTHTRQRLERFFHSTSEAEILELREVTQRRLENLADDDPSDANTQRKRKSLEDTLATADARHQNLERARSNFEFVNVELERIAAKLAGLAEMAVNHQDPGLITRNVDEVVESVQATEEAIGELQAFTGFTRLDEGTPSILHDDHARKAKMRQKTRT